MARQYQSGTGVVLSSTATRQYQSGTGTLVNDSTVGGLPTAVSITAAWTEGAEVFALSGTVTVSGIAIAAAWTEGAETFSAAGTVSAAMGTITTRKITNNTGFVRTNLAGCAINIYNETTGALVLHLTGLTSNSTGRLVIANAALVSGTSYAYEIDLTAAGMGRRLPLALAA